MAVVNQHKINDIQKYHNITQECRKVATELLDLSNRMDDLLYYLEYLRGSRRQLLDVIIE